MDYSTNKFNQYNLSPDIIKTLSMLGYISPTEIQAAIIPAALDGHDIVGKSQTGTGKTAAFAIPICEKTIWEENLPQALILEPTRELADQVKTETFNIGRNKRLKVVSLLGGLPVSTQATSLNQKAHIVVGTPGRVMDHIRRGNLDLSNIKYFIIDEADLMLNMGFVEEVEEIISMLPSTRITMLFSATINNTINHLVTKYLVSPLIVHIESETETVNTISQELYYVDSKDKYNALINILIKYNPKECMIFCATREMTNTLYRKLLRNKIKCGMLHGKLEQRERLQAIDSFREGQFHYLICTDVASRGIDFEKISHVINYDFPIGKETYVHRTGRTGRNGNYGVAISLVTPPEKKMVHTVEDYISMKIQEKEVPLRDTLNEDDFWKKQKEHTKRKEKKGAVLNKSITCLSISGGKKSKMRAVDIVGTICNINSISSEDIGIIDIRESLTYVEILNGKGDLVNEALQKKPVKGKTRKVKITKNMG